MTNYIYNDADIILTLPYVAVCENCGCDNYLAEGEVLPCDECGCTVAAPAE